MFDKEKKHKPDDGHCGEPPWHCGKPPKYLLWLLYIIITIDNMINFIRSIFCGCHKKPRHKHKLEKIKVAFVGAYGIHCGISTYNEELISELSNFVDIKVFAEYADREKTPNLPEDPEWVLRCWDRKSHPKKKLIANIKEWNPDIIHFSHEYGFFTKAYYFTSLISTLKLYGFKIVGTMHSVYNHIDKIVSESCVPYLIVHTKAAKNCLIEKGINPENIYILPHGSNILAGTPENPQLLDHLWNTWNSQHTIFQPGFLFDYKGHIRMLYIVARLKNKYPDIQYIIQGSENPHTMEEHDKVYSRIINIAEELDILENITINRGFVNRDILLSFIRTVKCCILPYTMHPEHNVRGTSGIARLIIGTTTPLITSNVHLFDDLDGIAIRCNDDEQIYEAIDDIFNNDKEKLNQMNNRKKFLFETSWKRISKKLYNIYEEILENDA